MRKNILYMVFACLALGFAACSEDPEDATSKHVYGEDESPYLRTDASATISYEAEFRRGYVTEQTINLADYAETIQAKMGMTVDDMLAALDEGRVVFYNINSSRQAWDKTAPTKGSNGWYYTASGAIATQENGVGSIELDRAARTLIVDVIDDAAAGIVFSTNVGFAVNNGTDYDKYVRFSVSFAVTDPGIIMPSIRIPEGDYSAYEIEFANYAEAIEVCMGMSVGEFCEAIEDSEGDIAMYMVDADGNWDTESAYTANGIGYWCDADGKVTTWGADGFTYFVESHGTSVGIGRAPGVAAGTQFVIHFVYANKNDHSKFVEFVVSATLE